jgi:hypothetical protein
MELKMNTVPANFVDTPFGPSLAPGRRASTGRNHFKELFEQMATPGTPVSDAQKRVAFSPPGMTIRSEVHVNQPDQTPQQQTRSAAAEGTNGPPASSATLPSAAVHGADLGDYKRMAAPVSLQPLTDALTQAGLSPNQFQFDQLESFEVFPTRPDLSYTNRQILIQGPHGAGLFDWTWALRTPWVTAVEIKSLGIA